MVWSGMVVVDSVDGGPLRTADCGSCAALVDLWSVDLFFPRGGRRLRVTGDGVVSRDSPKLRYFT